MQLFYAHLASRCALSAQLNYIEMTILHVWPYLSTNGANRRNIWLGELSMVLGYSWEALPCPLWLPYHLSSSFSSIFFFSSCCHLVRFTHFGDWCSWTHPYFYILIINLCLLFIIKCSLLCINACFGLITLCMMLWFKLLFGNAFELRNGEEHLMGFVLGWSKAC